MEKSGMRVMSSAEYAAQTLVKALAQPATSFESPAFGGNGSPPGHVPLNSPLRKGLRTVPTVPNIRHPATGQYPTTRVRGSEVFRRFPDGQLAVDAAKHRVCEYMDLRRDGIPLTDQQEMAVAVIFPEMSLIKPEFARLGIPLSDAETLAVRMAVQAHMAERENYNAGRGGGSIPGRSSTNSGKP